MHYLGPYYSSKATSNIIFLSYDMGHNQQRKQTTKQTNKPQCYHRRESEPATTRLILCKGLNDFHLPWKVKVTSFTYVTCMQWGPPIKTSTNNRPRFADPTMAVCTMCLWQAPPTQTVGPWLAAGPTGIRPDPADWKWSPPAKMTSRASSGHIKICVWIGAVGAVTGRYINMPFWGF